MPITEFLEQNSRLYPEETALVEINPQELENRHLTWKEYSLIVSAPRSPGGNLTAKQTALPISC